MFRKQQDCEHCPNIQDAISIASLNPRKQTNQTQAFLQQRHSHFSPAAHLPYHDTIQADINVATNHPRIPPSPPDIAPSNPLRKTRPLHTAITPPLVLPQPHIFIRPSANITDATVFGQCCKIQRPWRQDREESAVRLGY